MKWEKLVFSYVKSTVIDYIDLKQSKVESMMS